MNEYTYKFVENNGMEFYFTQYSIPDSFLEEGHSGFLSRLSFGEICETWLVINGRIFAM